MDILHSRTDPSLLTRLQQSLAGSVRADIAVGYFFISGFEALADDLANLDQVRILVGRTDQQVLEEVASGLQQSRALHLQLGEDRTVRRSHRSEVARQPIDLIASGVAQLPQRASSQAAVQRLRDLVAAGKIAVHTYLKSPLHAKAYLCWYPPHSPDRGSAVVGSSNLTLAGFEGNTELNVRVTGDAEMQALQEWFDDLWQDSEDVSDELVKDLDHSWAIQRASPYDIYLKALYELYHSGAGLGDLAAPVRDQQLANFQIDAVRQGLAMIDAHGGCYVGDVVGLGKSYVGAELLRQLQFSYPNEGKPLILAPASLIPMWQSFNEHFQLGAEVVSHSMIVPAGAPQFDEEFDRYLDADRPARGIVLHEKYADRGPVLIDEAHNFRNINQRSKGLQEYLDAGDHKVVLMSATPQNLGPMDIYRQLRLFLDDREHGLAIEPLSLEAYFGMAQQWLSHESEMAKYRSDYEVWERSHSTQSSHRPDRKSNRKPGRKQAAPPLEPKAPSIPHARIEQVLAKVFIRRRRRDVRDLYGDSALINDKPIHFPQPALENIDYRLDRVYARAGTFQHIINTLEQHQASRYRASEYLLKAASAQPRYSGLLRSSDRLAGLMKVLLLKRLESSVAAFQSTLESLLRSNRHFREALQAGYVPVGKLATRLLNGQQFDAEDALAILNREDDQPESKGSAYPAIDFRADDWIADLDSDYELLRNLREQVESIRPEDDDKLRALKQFLQRPDVTGGKVLIFSEAETTIEYLYEQLNPTRNPEIERLSGSNHERTESVIAQFSPHSNLSAERHQGAQEIRVLLATDIVSEGQNLQDCALVLNYDLHWNPVRLIQRFGRVDRIGSEHDVIHLHNMWPDLEVDSTLALTDRFQLRIQLFHDLIGLDNQLLSNAEKLNLDAMYRIYGEQQLPDADDGLDDVSVHQRAVATLQRIRDEQPELWTRIETLPDGIRSALTVRRHTASDRTTADSVMSESPPDAELVAGIQPALLSPTNLRSSAPSAYDNPIAGETLVLLGAGDINSCYTVGDQLQARPISPAQFITAAECDELTPTMPLPEGTNERVMAAFDQFAGELAQRLGRSRRPRNTNARRYVSKQLRIAREQAMSVQPDQAALRQIDDLRRIFNCPLSARAEAALCEIHSIQPQGRALLARLDALRETYRLTAPNATDAPRSPRPEIIRIVCSDGLVE